MGAPGGAGAVTLHELNALKAVFQDVTVLDGTVLTPLCYQHLGIPFLQDYFTVAHLQHLSQKDGPFSHGHFYSNGFTEAVWWLKQHGATVTYSTPAHDPAVSVEEFRLQTQNSYFPYPHIADPELYRLHGQGLVDADQVIAASSGSQRVVRDLGVKKVVVIPHGTEWPEIAPPFPERFAVGYLGQAGTDKGLVYLLRAVSLLKDLNIRLVIASESPVEEMVRREVGQGDVRLIGHVEKLSDFFQQVSVYCQPSVSEGFGIPALEAMAYGRPVIASVGAGSSDVVNEAGGICVGVRSVDEVAEAIRLFRDYPGLIIEHGERNRRVAQKYTWAKVEQMYRDVFMAFACSERKEYRTPC